MTRTRLAPDVRRDQILEAAARLVADDGLAAATVEEIARRAEVSKGLVYAYFDGRDALLGEVLQREQALLRERGMAAALQAASFAQLIEGTTRLWLEHARDRGALIATLTAFQGAGATDERDRTLRFFVRAVRREYGLGLAPAITAVDLLMALTDQAGRRVAAGQDTVEAATLACVALITGGLGRLSTTG